MTNTEAAKFGLSGCKPIADSIKCNATDIAHPATVWFDKGKRLSEIEVRITAPWDGQTLKAIENDLKLAPCLGDEVTDLAGNKVCYIKPSDRRSIYYWHRTYRYEANSHYVITIRKNDGDAHRHFITKRLQKSESERMKSFASGH